MNRADEQLLLRLAKVTHRTRAVLYALVLRGKELRQAEPARARCLLEVATAHPFYKASQLVFEMAEVAEAVREGPPPAHIDDALLAELMQPVLARPDIAEVVAACRAALERLDPQARPAHEDRPTRPWADKPFDLLVLGALNELLQHSEASRSRPVVSPV